jgi:chromosome segregation ATPase
MAEIPERICGDWSEVKEFAKNHKEQDPWLAGKLLEAIEHIDLEQARNHRLTAQINPYKTLLSNQATEIIQLQARIRELEQERDGLRAALEDISPGHRAPCVGTWCPHCIADAALSGQWGGRE